MENKTTSKKFMSIFWCILYSMPLLILIITFIGYLSFYREKGIIFIQEEEIIKTYNTESVLINEGVLNEVYLNSNLTVDEINTLVLESDIYNNLSTDNDFSNDFIDVYEYWLYFGNGGKEYNYEQIEGRITLYDYHTHDDNVTNSYGLSVGKYFVIEFMGLGTGNYEQIYFSDDKLALVYSNMTRLQGITLENDYKKGWNTDKFSFKYDIDFNFYGSLTECYYLNDYFLPLISKTEYGFIEEKIILSHSLFDLSLQHTNNTFTNFVMQPLYNVLNDFCVGIGINCNGLITNIIILIFTWFIQLSFIRILIDFILLLPNILRNFLKGVS